MSARRFAMAGAAVLAALALTSCSSSSGDDSSSGRIKLRVQVPPATDAAPIYLAQKKGLFAARGLDVSVVQGQGGAAITAALQSGATDVGFVNYVSLVSGISHHLPVTIIAGGAEGAPRGSGVYVKAGSPITKPADLKGKRIGIVSTGSISDLTTNAALTTAGLRSSDVRYVRVPLPNLAAALQNGQVDGAWLNELVSPKATAKGAVMVVDAFTGPAAGLPVAGYATSSAWAKKHADVITKFRAALRDAAQAAERDPAAVREIVPTFTSLTKAEAASMVLPKYSVSGDTGGVQRVADLMLRYGLLTQAVNVKGSLAP